MQGRRGQQGTDGSLCSHVQPPCCRVETTPQLLVHEPRVCASRGALHDLPHQESEQLDLTRRYSSTCDGNSASTRIDLAADGTRVGHLAQALSLDQLARRLAALEGGGQHRLGVGRRDSAGLHLADELREALRAERDVIGAKRIGGMLVQQPAELAGDPVGGGLGAMPASTTASK